MKVLLLDIYRKDVDYRISKDTNGSYGTGNDYGDSLLAKFLTLMSESFEIKLRQAQYLKLKLGESMNLYPHYHLLETILTIMKKSKLIMGPLQS